MDPSLVPAGQRGLRRPDTASSSSSPSSADIDIVDHHHAVLGDDDDEPHDNSTVEGHGMAQGQRVRVRPPSISLPPPIHHTHVQASASVSSNNTTSGAPVQDPFTSALDSPSISSRGSSQSVSSNQRTNDRNQDTGNGGDLGAAAARAGVGRPPQSPGFASSPRPSIHFHPSTNASQPGTPGVSTSGRRNGYFTTQPMPTAPNNAESDSSNSPPYNQTSHGVLSSGAAVAHGHSVAASIAPSSRPVSQRPPASRRSSKFTSTLLKDPGAIEKPWLEKGKDPLVRASWWVTVCLAMLGVLGSAVLCFFGYTGVPSVGNVCLVLDEEFNSPTLDTNIWSHDISLSGFGNGQFEWTTRSAQNSFVQDGSLYIVPTLTNLTSGSDPSASSTQLTSAQIEDNFNLTLPECTHGPWSTYDPAFAGTSDPRGIDTDCTASSNATRGTIINPVQSARLTTKLSKSIMYGKIEVRAKMPKGDWLWPAIWMLPVNQTYGGWPLSGEIDIVESRGNSPRYPRQGRNYVSSALHWGPTARLDSWWRTRGWWFQRRSSYDQDYHTYTLEWTDRFLWTFVDTRIDRMVDLRFNQPFFQRGRFPQTTFNGSDEIVLRDPWVGRGNSAPFDQPFYLILNVAVGGTNGWFPDGQGEKPWLDQSNTAMRDFARAADQWYPTWPADPKERAMAVDYVKMWQTC